MALPQRDSNGRFIKSTDPKTKKSYVTKAQLENALSVSLSDIKNLKQEIFDKNTEIENLIEKLYKSNVVNFILAAIILVLLIISATVKFY